MRQWGNTSTCLVGRVSVDWANKDKRLYCLIASLPHCPIASLTNVIPS
jgi:hypothetical protein